MSTNSVSPWLSIWIHPRRTIRHIVETDPDRYVLLLVAIAGIGSSLDKASIRSAGDRFALGTILLAALIVGPVAGIAMLYLGGALLRWTGRWIGGRATSRDIRCAIAWAGVVSIWAMILWVPQLLIFGKEIFTTETPMIDASLLLMALFLALGAIDIILGIWALVVFLKCLGEVQGFSAWKALGNILLACLVVLGPLLGIASVALLSR